MEKDQDMEAKEYFFDSHTHILDYSKEQLNENIKNALSNSVAYISACTTHQKQYEGMLNVYQKYSLPLKQYQKIEDLPSNQEKVVIIPSFGIHPCFIQHQKDNDEWSQNLQKMINNDPLYGVGQIGLDFRTNTLETNSKQAQTHFFQTQFELAFKYNRPVTVHCVRAYGQMLKFFKKFNKNIENKDKNNKEYELSPKTPIIMHSYGGSKEITKSLIKLSNLNIFFSLSLKRSEQLCSVIPLQKLILQTDAPYQPNYPLLLQQKIIAEDLNEQQREYLSKTNKVHFVRANYSSLYKYYNISHAQFTKAILLNSLKAFRLLL